MGVARIHFHPYPKRYHDAGPERNDDHPRIKLLYGSTPPNVAACIRAFALHLWTHGDKRDLQKSVKSMLQKQVPRLWSEKMGCFAFSNTV